MSDRVTVKEIRAVVASIEKMAETLGILEGGEWTADSPEPIPAHLVESRYRFPHLVLEEGSATYGRAWRLNGSGGDRYRTGHSDPFRLGSGYLGSTKSEAMRALRGIQAGLWSAMDSAERDNYRAGE